MTVVPAMLVTVRNGMGVATNHEAKLEVALRSRAVSADMNPEDANMTMIEVSRRRQAPSAAASTGRPATAPRPTGKEGD